MRDRSNLTFKFTGEAHILEDGKFFTRFKSPRGNTVFYDGDNDIIIDKYTLLESMSACESRENLYEIEKLLCTLFSCDFDSSFSRMYSYVMGSKLEEFRHHEFYYQDEFKKKCESLGFGSIVEHKNIKGHIPDAWVNKNGELIPVEVKVDKFNASALKQLSRYMSVYNTKHGYAVAKRLTVMLPKNITFIPFSDFMDKEG